MHAVILSFPGHFYQTHLTVQSLERFYPEIDRITFILDDAEQGGWHTYTQDFERSIHSQTSRSFDIILTSDLDPIRSCVAGWWRQQLAKLVIDRILPGDQWFVVDGDTVFVTRCDIRDRVPITHRNDRTSNFSIMSENYVRTLLGISSGYLTDHVPVCTNAVPFRYLDRSLLESLRQHVESRFDRDFVKLHLDWFADQTIVADWNPPDRMTMSEWELIECYRRYVQHQELPFADVGSGYTHDVDFSEIGQTRDVFVHAYRWDTEIGSDWFESRGVSVDPTTWQKQSQWYLTQRRPR